MTAPDYQLCVIGAREHRAHDGLLACSHHAQELATLLREVEDEAALLDPRKSMALRYEGKAGGLASEQSPVRLEVLVLTDRRRNSGRLMADDHDPLGLDDTPEVLHVLQSWAQQVREERHLAEPTQVTVSGERDLLTRQLPWILGQPWVADLYAEVRELAQVLRRTNGTQTVAAGVCSTVYEGVECGGTVWHVEIDHPGETPEPGFRCGKCRRVWTGTEAVRLRHQLWLDEQERQATA